VLKLSTLQDIFASRAFMIPDYQRGYAWEDEQRKDLLNDLEDLERVGGGKQHYTGTLVVHKGAHEPSVVVAQHFDVLDIVDGQQRLTTLVVFLSCIATRLSALHLPEAEETAHEIRRCYVKFREIYKLTLNGSAQQFFQDHVLGDAPNPSPRLPAERNLLAVKKQFAAYLDTHVASAKTDAERIARLEALVALLTQRLGFVFFEVQHQAEVGVMFEVMNARGKPLTQFEKVKNYLLYVAAKVSDGQRLKKVGQDVNETWCRVLARLDDAGGNADEDALVRYHWAIYPGATWFEDGKPEKTYDIHRAIKETISPRSAKPDETYAQIEGYLLSLRGAGDAYVDLVCPDQPRAFGFATASRDALVAGARRLRRLDRSASLMPLLMASCMRYGSTLTDLVELHRLAEVLVFRLLLLEKRSQAGVSAAYRLARKIATNALPATSAHEELRSLVRHYADDNVVKMTLLFPDSSFDDGDYYHWSGILYFLYEYERHLVEQSKQKFTTDWEAFYRRGRESIEHILPQGEETLTKDYWKARFTDKQFRSNRHRLGNLTLTEWNGSLGSKGFDDKKGQPGAAPDAKVYRNSKWLCERELVNCAEWTEKEISERQTRLTDFAMKRWAL
jgi:hypothetical protein